MSYRLLRGEGQSREPGAICPDAGGPESIEDGNIHLGIVGRPGSVRLKPAEQMPDYRLHDVLGHRDVSETQDHPDKLTITQGLKPTSGGVNASNRACC
jgi:hypothetical protein